MAAERLAHFQETQVAEVTQLVGDGTWLTTAEAADLLGCSTTHVINLIKRRELEARLLPGSTHRRIKRSAVEALIGSDTTPDAARPELQPVVAAIVTSDRGVLVGRRNDGKPPWTFIAGEIEPGESAADAAVREVKEETGLLVEAAAREIGRRVHPQTGRTMIYLACHPTGKLEVFVGDADELAEVRWVRLAEAEELLPGLYGPVRAYVARELREGGSS